MPVETNVANRAYEIPLTALAYTGWQFARSDVTALIEKLGKGRRNLAEVVDGQICMGVKSGLVEAFVVDKPTRDHLIAKNPEAVEVIKPLVNGRDIRRYFLQDQQQFLIYTYHGVNIKRYPAIQAHLRPFKQKLENRATEQEWYELQQPQLKFAPLMNGPKIIFPDIATESRFTLDEKGFYGTNTVYFIPHADHYLLALLNSRLAFFFFREICAGLEGTAETYLRFFGQYLERFPVVEPNVKSRNRIADLAASMLSIHISEDAENHPQRKEQIRRQISATDRQIDQLVYELYGLTNDEIRIVEEATQ